MRPPRGGTRRNDDCMRRAVACLLEIPYRETCPVVPGTINFWSEWRLWAAGRGLDLRTHNGPGGPNSQRGQPELLDGTIGPWPEWIAVVRSLSGGHAAWPLHAIVMEGVRIFWDPNRNNARRRLTRRSVIYALTFEPLHTGADTPPRPPIKGGPEWGAPAPLPPTPLDDPATLPA